MYVHAGQAETTGTCNMSEGKQTLLFPGELGFSAHRVCRAIEIVTMHCKPYTTDGRWSSAHSICCIRAHALLADYNSRQMELTTCSSHAC